MLPAKTPLPLPASVRWFAPRSITEPATPDSVPIDCGVVAPATLKCAPAPLRLTADAARLPPAPIASVPLPIVVPPVNVSAAVSVVVPGPLTLRPPVPR